MSEKIYDYIIVGSGPGGGVVAYNLTKAGASCLMIEAGKQYSKDTFPKNEADASAQLYWGGGMEFSHDAKMVFLRGKSVGGSSIVNQALLDPFDEVALYDWRSESGVEYFNPGAMEKHYVDVEEHLALHTFSTEERTNNAKLFVKGMEKLGHKWHFLRRAQDDCANEKGNDCILCLGGCHRDSKQSSLVAFIQKALADHGLEIADQTMAEKIEKQGNEIIVHTTSKGEKKSYRAKRLILAGGSFGTTQLLLRSGFGEKLPAVGKYFTTHPQFMFFALFDQEVNAHKGYFQSVASKDDDFRRRGFKLENVFAGPATTALLFNSSGTTHQKIMQQYRHLVCAEVAVRDENSGVMRIDRNGNLKVEKSLTDQDKRRMNDGTDVLRNVLAASGAREVIDTPLYFGLHLMGGARMGVDPNTSVTDPEFHVHGHDNIYVTDSSLFPNAPGINPAMTVMALAMRLSDQLVGGN